MADRGLLLLGLGALALWLLGRQGTTAPPDGSEPAAATPSSALGPPISAAPTPFLALPDSSHQADTAAWLAQTRGALAIVAPVVASVAAITRAADAAISAGPLPSPEIGATGGTVVPDAIAGGEAQGLTDLFGARGDTGGIVVPEAIPNESGSLAELLNPTPKTVDLGGVTGPTSGFVGLDDYTIGATGGSIVPEAVPGESAAWSGTDVLGGAMASLGVVTAGLSIFQDTTSAREDWQKAALVGLDTAKLSQSVMTLYGIVAAESAATTVVSSVAPYLSAATAAVSLGFDVASKMPDEQKAVAAFVDTSAIAIAFVPVYGWVISAALLVSKMFIMPLIFGTNTHAEREAAEAQRVYGAVGGIIPAITNALTPTDLWATLLDWTARELPGPSRVVIAYQPAGRDRVIIAANVANTGSAVDLIAADPSTITVTVSAGVRPAMLTAASDAIAKTLSAHVARLAGAIRGDAQPLRELVAIYRRAAPDYLLSPITATEDAEVPLLAEALRSQYYNAIAHLFDSPDWRQFMADKLTDEWAQYVAAVAAGERRAFVLFLGYPDVMALRAAVFAGTIGQGLRDPELPPMLAEIRRRRALLPPLQAQLEHDERWADAHGPLLRQQAAAASDAAIRYDVMSATGGQGSPGSGDSPGGDGPGGPGDAE